jgi:hypothetical protein
MITAGLCSQRDIEAVLMDDEIYDRISNDVSPPKEHFQIPHDGVVYIGGYIDGLIASLFIVHDGLMHFMVLPDYRRFARELLAQSFRLWPFKVRVEIPVLYRPVINFARNFGFKDVGINKEAHLKNGKLHDEYILTYEA